MYPQRQGINSSVPECVLKGKVLICQFLNVSSKAGINSSVPECVLKGKVLIHQFLNVSSKVRY